jgi:O-antigen/teichoic acid export membrane protein
MTESAMSGSATSKGKSMTSRTVWLATAKSVAYALNIAVPLVLVRQMTRAEYGTYQQAFQIVTTAVALLPLGFGMSAYFFLPREPDRRSLVIRNILLVHGGLGAVALLLLLAAPTTTTALVGNPEVAAFAPMIGLAILLWIFSGFLETVTLANEEVVLAPALVVASQLSKTALMLGAAIWAPTLRVMLAAAVVHGLLQTLVLFRYLQHRFPGFWRGFDRDLFRRQLQYAGPYGLSTLLWVLQTDLHAFFVSRRFGEEQFAIYRVGCFQLPFVGLLNESVNAVLIPRISQLQQMGNVAEIRRLVVRVVRQLSALILPLFTMLLVLNREFIVGLFSTKYASSSAIFSIYLVMIPTSILLFDSVVRAYPDLGRFVFRFRLVVVGLLVAGLWVGTAFLDLRGITTLIVSVAVLERTVVAARIAAVIGMTRHDYAGMRDVGKVAAACLLATVATLGVRAVLADVAPLMVLVVGGATFSVAYVAGAFSFSLPTPEERAMLRAVVTRLRAPVSRPR